jgi:hypothetical protein
VAQIKHKTKRKLIVGGDTTVHVSMTDDLKGRLEEMALNDQRKIVDFVRVLIDSEWKRRAAAQNGASV